LDLVKEPNLPKKNISGLIFSRLFKIDFFFEWNFPADGRRKDTQMTQIRAGVDEI